MKKLLGIGTLALALTALATPRASAWSNFHFGVGLDISYQAGNNCFLWGLFRNGPTGFEPGNWAYGPGPGFFPNGFGGPAPAPAYGYGDPGYAAAPAPGWTAPPPRPQPPPAKKDNKGDSDQARTMYSSSYYQAVSYPQASYPQAGYNYGQAYPYGGSYYPYGAGSYYHAPSYWYGW